MSQLPLTAHAKLRRRQRGITEHQIEAAITMPDCTYSDDEITVFRRDGVMVFVDQGGSIVTVARQKEGAVAQP